MSESILLLPRPRRLLSLFGRIAIVLALLAARAAGATWHVSPAGDDAAAGSEAAPLRTLAAALGASAAGETILLERGGVYREQELTVAEGRVLSAYGDAAAPLPSLRGSVEVGNFQPVSGSPGLLQASFNASVAAGEPMVFVNGARMTLARHPDSGWLRCDNGTTAGAIVDAELAALPDARAGFWTGAQARWRRWSWWYETRTIQGDDGAGTLSIGGGSSGSNVGVDSGYYIDNHLAALDAPGEWYWHKAARRLYLYPPAGVDPATMIVEVAVASNGLTIDGATVRGLNVSHYTDTGMRVTAGGIIEDCVIEHIWNRGIFGSWNAAGSQLRGNVIRDVLNIGIAWNENRTGPGGSVIERNHLLRIGNVPGLGGGGSWHAAGVIIYNAPSGANGVQFRLNRVEYTGYAGIILGGDGQTVERNVFRNTMNTLNDGGAIYTNCSLSVIRENIILDTKGDLESSHPWTPLGHGIWPEFLESFRNSQIIGNTVYGSGGAGLFLPNNFFCTISDNIFLSNERAGMLIGGHEEGRSDRYPNQDHSFRDNFLGIGALPWAPSGYRNLATWGRVDDVCLSYKTYTDRDLDFGSMSGTVFVTGDGADLVFASDGRELTIPRWQELEPQWADPAPLSVTGAAYLFINDTGESVDFPLPRATGWTRPGGTPAGDTVELAPFRSAVLLADAGVLTGLPGYQLYSELPGPGDFDDWIRDLGATVDSATGVVEFRYSLRHGHSGWNVIAETSPDLATWSEAAPEQTGASTDPEFGDWRVTAPAGAPVFLRLRVE
ncbi:MAG: right-handed parallel beta-helix repeat-containing protein [Oceanipulchritudo sp.]